MERAAQARADDDDRYAFYNIIAEEAQREKKNVRGRAATAAMRASTKLSHTHVKTTNDVHCECASTTLE